MVAILKRGVSPALRFLMVHVVHDLSPGEQAYSLLHGECVINLILFEARKKAMDLIAFPRKGTLGCLLIARRHDTRASVRGVGKL